MAYLENIYKLYYFATIAGNLKKPPLVLEKLRDQLLRGCIENAYQYIPFYRQMMSRLGLKPCHIQSVHDLKLLPSISRKEVREAAEDGRIIHPQYRYMGVVRTTSGSSGMPLKIVYDLRGYAYTDAVYARAMLAEGVSPWDRRVYFWHQPLASSGPWEKLGLFCRSVILGTQPENFQAQRLMRLKPSVIYAFPSLLASIIPYYQKICGSYAPRLIITHGELLNDMLRKKIESVFNAPILDHYASNEFNLIAWQCREGKRYHINIDQVYIELVDERGDEVADGERGRLLITSLVNRAMPLLRYDIGDYGIRSRDLCSCGRSFPCLESLEGRQDDFIRTSSTRYISPRRIGAILERFAYIKEYQFVQEGLGSFVLFLVPCSFVNESQKEKIRLVLTEILGQAARVDIRVVQSIQRNRGKIRAIIARCGQGM